MNGSLLKIKVEKAMMSKKLASSMKKVPLEFGRKAEAHIALVAKAFSHSRQSDAHDSHPKESYHNDSYLNGPSIQVPVS